MPRNDTRTHMAPRPMTFADWCNEVNAELVRQVGVGREDLPDCDYYSMWDAGESPSDAARTAFEHASDEMGYDEDSTQAMWEMWA